MSAGAPQPASVGRSQRAAAMPFIMATALIDMIAIGLIIPVLPALVGTFTGSQTDQAFWYGVMTFSFSIANFFGAPLLGALSDSYGRRPVLLVGFSGLAITFLATAVVQSLAMLVVIRLIGGGMQANLSVANAYVADITPPEERARRFGMLGAMFGVGFILGPVLGGLLGDISLRLPFFVAGSLAMVNLAYGCFVLPESLPVERRHRFDWHSANPLSVLGRLAQLRRVGPLALVLALCGLAQFVMYTSWVLYTTFKFGWGPKQNGWSLAAVGVTGAIVQGVLLGRLLERFSARRLAVIALISATAAYLMFGLISAGWMMYVVIFANLFGSAAAPAFQSIISTAADARDQGKTMGAVSGINSLMAVVAPMLGAPLLTMVSHLPKGDWRIGAPFYLCALLQLLGLLFAVHYFRAHRQTLARG